jgi:hypothetical protein
MGGFLNEDGSQERRRTVIGGKNGDRLHLGVRFFEMFQTDANKIGRSVSLAKGKG